VEPTAALAQLQLLVGDYADVLRQITSFFAAR
jgi:hypothetical protein